MCLMDYAAISLLQRSTVFVLMNIPNAFLEAAFFIYMYNTYYGNPHKSANSLNMPLYYIIFRQSKRKRCEVGGNSVDCRSLCFAFIFAM